MNPASPHTATAHRRQRMRRQAVTIDSRYRGGAGQFAHGGYAGGLLAAALGTPAAEVRFEKPIPVGCELELRRAPEGRIELRADGAVHAFAVPASVAIDIPAPPTVEDARAAGSSYAGHDEHRSPDCFACGTLRDECDGLRVFPGSWDDDASVVAGVWTPQPHDAAAEHRGAVRPELVWAALECTELWSLTHDAMPSLRDRIVTRSLATRVERPVVAGRPHVVVGWPIARDRRMILAGGAVFDADGSLCALSRQTAVVAAAPARGASANPLG